MTMRIRPRAWLFLAAGLAITGIEVYGCIEYLLRQQGHWSYIVVLGGVVTGAAALIPMAAEMSWRDGRRFLAGLVSLAAIPAMATIFLAAVERTGAVRDMTVHAQLDASIKLAAALRAEADAKAAADADEAAARSECASGRKGKCLGLEERALASRQRLSEARLGVVAVGSPPLDPQARRVAAMLSLSETQVQLYGPLILPITGSLLGILFLAVGGRLEHARVVAAPEELVARPPVGNVARFMVECMPAAADQRVEIADAFATYRGWCSDNALSPQAAADFRFDFLEVCKRARIRTKRESGKVYCEGRMLAA